MYGNIFYRTLTSSLSGLPFQHTLETATQKNLITTTKQDISKTISFSFSGAEDMLRTCLKSKRCSQVSAIDTAKLRAEGKNYRNQRRSDVSNWFIIMLKTDSNIGYYKLKSVL